MELADKLHRLDRARASVADLDVNDPNQWREFPVLAVIDAIDDVGDIIWNLLNGSAP
jgi:hypothetical protein